MASTRTAERREQSASSRSRVETQRGSRENRADSSLGKRITGHAVDHSLEAVADRLDRGDITMRGLTRAARDFAKRQPLLFYSASFALGFGSARFLRCTSKSAFQ